jgi:multiple sugar transport system permease protein
MPRPALSRSCAPDGPSVAIPASATAATAVVPPRDEEHFALGLLLPSLLVLALTTTLPIVYLIWSSLQRINPSMSFMNGFAGADNYVQIVGDPRFWYSLRLTLVYTGSTVILQVVIGLVLALAIMEMRHGQWLARLIAILPIVLAPVVVGLYFRTLILTPTFGMFDYLMATLGLGSHNWLGDPQLALFSVIAIHTWQWTPFSFLVLLAALAALPQDIYEAARMDRASALRRFWHITLPLLRPVIMVVVILRLTVALSAFAAIFAATGGGPGNATEILNLYAYRTSFNELQVGYGAALAVTLLAITLSTTVVLFRLRRRS